MTAPKRVAVFEKFIEAARAARAETKDRCGRPGLSRPPLDAPRRFVYIQKHYTVKLGLFISIPPYKYFDLSLIEELKTEAR